MLEIRPSKVEMLVANSVFKLFRLLARSNGDRKSYILDLNSNLSSKDLNTMCIKLYIF